MQNTTLNELENQNQGEEKKINNLAKNNSMVHNTKYLI